ncbi:MAG TPA: hypothetical protein VIO64_09645 [Pseudobacteroides sp.]|uniref:hypothetical protein n=1 Tax=Pseudobacteroides sp. TaxID=1968840 RepID=UPI002F929754
MAGGLCVVGYVFIQPKLQGLLKGVDTCGVIAIFVRPNILTAQVAGIIITVVLAFASGSIAGFIIKATGKKQLAYEDKDEFIG